MNSKLFGSLTAPHKIDSRKMSKLATRASVPGKKTMIATLLSGFYLQKNTAELTTALL
ncbi:hypothetical protein [Liquorilactobacillus uvarum]|uniref:hypothetical protein n=1 Tax=Liquorilactobacillus uvarum TaxID=303240 RepID=UPI00288B2B43|nr:hypothetical protein [Liquorilactobacillus uvarum]